MNSSNAFRAGALALCAVLVAGCAAPPAGRSVQEARVAAPDAAVQPQPQQQAQAQLTPAERAFLRRAAFRNAYEIEVSKLAAGKAVNPAVREFAQTMVAQQSRLNDELVAIMNAHGVAPPKGLPADRATKLHRLAALPRSDAFDNGYVKVIGIEDRRSAIRMFEKARGQVRDAGLRAFIDRSLAVLRAHLATAQGVAASSG
jgi:putative membrane protein